MAGAGLTGKPLRVETVRGKAYQIAGKRLTPVARAISFGRGRGTLRLDRVEGWGLGFARISPRAVIVESEEGETYLPLVDVTAEALRGMALAAVALTLALALVRWVARRRRWHR
ncbi:MAG: hypothetical protein PVF47_14965 [Anaerolineae bacterium]|jgi:hypothetical protein